VISLKGLFEGPADLIENGQILFAQCPNEILSGVKISRQHREVKLQRIVKKEHGTRRIY